MEPVGKSINNYTIFGFDLRREDWQNYLAAVCNCGQMFFISAAEFEAQKTNPCKCQSKEKEKIQEEKYGSWTVVGKGEYRGTNKYLPCKCECGTTRLVAYSSLKQGRSVSCGCLSAAEASGLQMGKPGRRGKLPEPDVSGLMKQGEAAISMLNGIRMMRHDPDFRLMMLQMFNMVISSDGSEPDYKLEKEV